MRESGKPSPRIIPRLNTEVEPSSPNVSSPTTQSELPVPPETIPSRPGATVDSKHAHRWKIGEVNGERTVPGVCKGCGDTKDFRVGFDEYAYMEDRERKRKEAMERSNRQSTLSLD